MLAAIKHEVRLRRRTGRILCNTARSMLQREIRIFLSAYQLSMDQSS